MVKPAVVAEAAVEEDFYGVLKGVRSLWEDKMLLDYTIEVEDQEFRVHKVILAATSDYFKAMLTGGMAESQTDRVRLEGLTALAVANMIQLMYKAEFCATKPDIEELVEAAMYLQMPGAIDDCKLLLADDITPQNCFKLLSTLQTYSATDCIEDTVEYIKSHFEEVYEAWKPEEMMYTDINNFVDMWQKSEWDLFLAIKHWVDVDIEDRLPHLNDLMSHVRFALMTPEQLEAIKGNDLYCRADGSWCENVNKALEYHTLPTHAKVLVDSEQSRVRGDANPFYFDSDSHEHYQLRQDTSWTGSDKSRRQSMDCMTWQKCEALEKPEIGQRIVTFVVVNDFLIVGDQFNQNLHILDPRMMKWSPMASTTNHCCLSALVSCNKHLYVLGGCPQAEPTQPTDIIEKYDFQMNSWSIIPNKLPDAVARPGAAVIGDCIYVAGGLMLDEDWSQRLDCFNTTTQTWHSKATLPSVDDALRKLQVMEYCNEKVLFIMSDDLVIQYYRPSQDQWFWWKCNRSVTQGWTRGSSNLVWHSRAAVLSDQKNTLFMLNFRHRHPHDNPSDDENNSHLGEGMCKKWTVSRNGKEIVEQALGDFPVVDYGESQVHRSHTRMMLHTRLMLLAVPPQPTAPLTGVDTNAGPGANGL